MTAAILRAFAAPPESADAIAMRAWMAQEIAHLPAEERARYDASESFRDMAHGALAFEWRNPRPTPMEQEAAESYGGDTARCFVEKFVAFVLRHHATEEAVRIATLRVDRYGTDFARELAEIEDGTHPVQQLRC